MEAILCVVANVRDETPCGPHRQNSSLGHKHFVAGAKVYCLPARWDLGLCRLEVIGLHRGSKRLVCTVVDGKYLTNWRSTLVYDPKVIEKIKRETIAPLWNEATAEDFIFLQQKFEKQGELGELQK